MSSHPKLEGEAVEGIRYVVTDPDAVDPVTAGVHVLDAFYRQAPDDEKEDFFSPDRIGRLAGTDELRMMIQAGASPEEIAAAWESGVEAFNRKRETYLLYD